MSPYSQHEFAVHSFKVFFSCAFLVSVSSISSLILLRLSTMVRFTRSYSKSKAHCIYKSRWMIMYSRSTIAEYYILQWPHIMSRHSVKLERHNRKCTRGLFGKVISTYIFSRPLNSGLTMLTRFVVFILGSFTTHCPSFGFFRR